MDAQIQVMFAGGAAGIVAKTFCAPLERVKILNQLGESTGVVGAYRDVLQKEGTLGFWRGNLTNCVRVFPAKAVLFWANAHYKKLLSRWIRGETPWLKDLTGFFAGSLAGFTAVAVTYPLDFTRTRLAGKLGSASRPTSMFAVLHHAITQEGLFSLYRGIGPTLAGALPFEGIKFGVYDALHRIVHAELKQVTTLHHVACGGVAGMCAQIVMFPNDLVRRRLQMQGMDGSPRIYKNALHCYWKLFQEGGFLIFYRGMSVNIVRAVPNTAIQFAAFEALKSLIFPQVQANFNPAD